MRFLNMSEHVQTCSDSIWYESLWFVRFLNMSKLVQNQYYMILKHVKTWNQNMTKYSKIWANGTKKRQKVNKPKSCSLDPFEQVKQSKNSHLSEGAVKISERILTSPMGGTGKSLSEALLFAEHGEDMLCTEIVLNVKNIFCTQHVLPMFWAWNFHVLIL